MFSVLYAFMEAVEPVVAQLGSIYAYAGAALAMVCCGLGSAIAVSRAGSAVAGVAAEAPDRQNKAFLLQLLPATQGLYGLIIAFLMLMQMGAIGGNPVVLSNEQGMAYFVAAIPISIVGYVSAIYQGKAAISGINMVAKRADANAFGIPAAVETFAIFAFLISLFMVFGVAA